MENSSRDGNTRPSYLSPEKSACRSDQEATVRTEHFQCFKIGKHVSKLAKEYIKAVYCHPAYLTYMQSTLCKMPGWMTHSWNQDCQEKYQ